MTVEKPVRWIRRRQVIDDLISKHESDLAKVSHIAADLPRVSPTWRSRMSERRRAPCACASEQSLCNTDS
jgi:hypothetical protein